MDPSHSGSSSAPAPIGFELQNMEAGHGSPPSQPTNQQLYPSLDNSGPGPTPVETVPQPDPAPVVSATAVNAEGLQDSDSDSDLQGTGEAASLLRPATGEDVKPTVTDPECVGPTVDQPDAELQLMADLGERTDASPEDLAGGPSEERSKRRETLYFNDGKSRIDYVLAFKASEDPDHETERETFEKNLRNEGLQLEYEDRQLSQDGKTTFVKVHATWEVLTKMAELLKIKMPIREYDIDNPHAGCLDKLGNPLEISDDILKPGPDYFTADFNRQRADMFIIPDRETFFTNAQRSLCVNELLLRTPFDNENKNKFGIDKLLRHGTYTAAFPLHEGQYLVDQSILVGVDNDRQGAIEIGTIDSFQLLYETWAKPGRWYYFQPLDLIRKYFGEKIGIYFAWLGFYTAMLIPASVVGFIVFIYGVATLFENEPSEDICDQSGVGNLTMCPLCDGRCPYWRLHTSCTYSRLTYLFDNAGTVFFAGFMAIWATMFLEFWKRKQAEIQYDWDVASFEFEERMRPEFEARCQKYMKVNPITQSREPFLPLCYKLSRKCTSIGVVLFMILCVMAAVFGVIMYRIIIVAVLYASDDELIKQNAKITTTVTAALISLVVIVILNKVYERLALFLTEFERPRTDTEYENSFTMKMFLFQFINYYSSIFYIAFFKGRFTGYPAQYYNVFDKYRLAECDPAGCLIELCLQLAIVMVGKQTFNNFKEICVPKIFNWLRSWRSRKETKENLYTRWEQDNDLTDMRPMGLFEEYLEMVIQYGFVTIFVAAFPLAPLFALLNNVIEIRLDAYKFTTQWKRPVSARAQDIGIWFGILQGISFLAVLSNAFIIGWTSDYIPKLVYRMAESSDNSLTGYVNYSLSYFDVNDFQERSVPDDKMEEEFGVVRICRYADFREPPWNPNKYEFTTMYWHTFTARLAFIIVFEHVIFFLTWLVMYLIPDMPGEVKQLMLREVHLAKEARYSAAFSNIGDDQHNPTESKSKRA